MPIFNKNKPADPVSEPEPDPQPQPPPEPKYVEKEEFDKVAGQLKSLTETLNQVNLRFETFGQQTQSTPAPAAGPSTQDQIAEIETQLSNLDAELVTATKEYDSDKIAKVIKTREQLNRKLTKLETEATWNPQFAGLRDQGMTAITQLSEQLTAGQMPYLSIPEVKLTFDGFLKTLPAEARMSPASRMEAYNLAVGRNVEKVSEAIRQEVLRSAEQSTPQDPSNQTGRTNQSNPADKIPKPEEVLSPENLQSLRIADKTPDQYYQRMGYEGWEDYYKRNRSYFEEGEE